MRGGFTSRRAALALFLAQPLFNALWSPLFFGLHRPGIALADLLLLWLALFATVAAFWKAHRVAGGMLLPYLAWVSFAGALNFAIWKLNPSKPLGCSQAIGQKPLLCSLPTPPGRLTLWCLSV